MLHDRSALGRLVGSRLLAQRRIALLLRYGDDPASAAGLLEDRAEAAGEVGRRSVGDAQLDPTRLVTHQMHVVPQRSEEHPSELQSLMRISSAVFCFQQNN